MTARILIVDDPLPNVKLLEAKLSAEYFDVVTAGDGPTALKLALEQPPDLILLDVMMPGMDGFEVCRRLRREPRTRHIPVVMVTALTDVADRVRGLEAGADDFLSKPVNDVALFARVRSLVRLKLLVDELRVRQTGAGTNVMEDPNFGTDAEIADARILLVDGQPRHMERLSQFLQDAGHHVQAVGNVQAALTLSQTDSHLDLVIVGIDVGGQDGLRLCSQLRSQETTRHVPILLVLEDMDLPRLAKGLDLGVTDYLFKPVDKNELKARVRTQIRRRRYHDRLRSMLDRSVSLAFTDPLTGAYNRRFLETHLDQRLLEAIETSKPLSLAIFDIDHFKSVNDVHGHAAGDSVLKAVVDRIARNVRTIDLLVRYGGEEFVLIMPDTVEDQATAVADRLRMKIAEAPIVVGEAAVPLSITVSMGVASLTSRNETLDQLLERADAALYAAKRSGRNRVIVASRLPRLAAG